MHAHTKEPAEPQAEQTTEAKPSKKKQFLQFLTFTGFSVSAGVIQFVTTGLLSDWTGWLTGNRYWIAYLIGLVLSVVWNFTFNRKFTFKSASNVPLSMGLVVIYYCAFTPLSTFGADAIQNAWETAAGADWKGAYEMVITASMMIINFLTEFIWDKFVVFNKKVTDGIIRIFKKKSDNADEAAVADETPNKTNETLQEDTTKSDKL